MGLNLDMWDWQLAPLLQQFRVIRYDLLGHGDSGPAPAGCEMTDLVSQLHLLLDNLEITRAALVGFSLGGMIARAFTIAHPAYVAALAILNSPHDRSAAERAAIRSRYRQSVLQGHATTVEAALNRWFTDEFAARRPDVLNRVRQWMARNDPLNYPEVYRILAEGDAALASAITAIRCPTLIVACEEDHGNSPDMACRMAALIPGARTAIIPKLRHMALAEDPEAVSSVLVPFLEAAWAG
jgi:pimeloyl-ACP methyl ester carboxylesterase